MNNLNLMSRFRRLALAIRQLPGLRHLGPLLRKPYKWVLGHSSGGVEVCLGRCIRVVMPSSFCTGPWETYEIEEIQHVVHWLDEHPKGLVLDVGCSVGIYTVITLSRSPDSEVIGFDPDLPSLKATQRICTFVDKKRLRVIHGFISNRHTSGVDANSAAKAAEEALHASGLSGELGTTEYRYLEKGEDRSIPTHSLDGLWSADGYPNRPILLKMDVEGAEQLVLEGATKLLARQDVTLAVSVHPPFLPNFGHSSATVRRLLEAAGYHIEIIAVDHEEHWWCEKSKQV